MNIHAYAAEAAKAPLEPYEHELEELGPSEVDVKITHSGICHTDLSLIDNEWGISRYPLIAGHEVAGVVCGLGKNVDPTRLRIGQRVAVGAISGACMSCEWCEDGKHAACLKRVDTVLLDRRGGFASHIRVSNWRFAYPIPEEIASEHAGPLLCAGITVFTPLIHQGVRPIDRVAVVGIGGLGHLALQFLAKWGCEVTAISSSRDKAPLARELGAAHHISTADSDAMQKVAGSFDFILSTVSADLPWDEYLGALRPRSKLCIAGIPQNKLATSPLGLLAGEKAMVGAMPGSIVETTQMLAFSARHHIAPYVELFPMSEINRALEHTRQGRARFRAVLTA